jgi:membrane fusion protein, multidrug efflux system
MKFLKAVVLITLVIVVLVGFFWWTIRRMLSAVGPMPSGQSTVVVAEPVIDDVLTFNEFTGNLESVALVDIRARVEGYLQQIAFTDGAFVKSGDVLFEIEPEIYQARRDQAQATLQSAQADMERAVQDYERALEAAKSNAVSQQQVSTYKAQMQMADAAVIAAKAALVQAEQNLSYTTIRSPIDGRISRNYVDAGNLVGAGENTLLATVVKLDPIYVYFNAGESEYLNYTKDVRRHLADEPNQLPLYLSLANKEEYAHPGSLDYMANGVDPATGTLQIRGIVPNPDYQLYPGMFVRLRVPIKTLKDALLVQEKAIGTDIGGKYLLLVDAENIVRHQPVQLGPRRGQLCVVMSGLKPNERYIVSGLQSVYPGSKVNPVPEGSQPPAETQPQPTSETNDKPTGDEAQ